ncbi:hypothetical protein MLD38_030375 [Melastoma candidum]|uniref:Uncharacterized protein n=1 Tax=Melastoma candidum TaxID=119954 RepID=A0ACB9MNC4_9MYRT|nr:hypothetical protein MLD38_030375 [Melastoma candidum]
MTMTMTMKLERFGFHFTQQLIKNRRDSGGSFVVVEVQGCARLSSLLLEDLRRCRIGGCKTIINYIFVS